MEFEDIILKTSGMLIRGVYTEEIVTDHTWLIKARRFPFRYEIYRGEETRYGGLSEEDVSDDLFEGTLLLADSLSEYFDENGVLNLEGEGYIKFGVDEFTDGRGI